MSILFKFLGGCLTLLVGKILEDNDDFGGCWIALVLFYTLMIVSVMGHFGYFNS